MEITSRICTKCNKELPLDAFNKCCTGKYGRRAMCRECEHEMQNTPERKARRRELEKQRREDPEYVKERNAKDSETRHTNITSLKKAIVRAAKQRANTKALEFDITYEDIELPETCPLLGIKLGVSPGGASDYSFSLDRIDSSKGYTKDNIWVISNKANIIKNNATLAEIELIAHNLKIKLSKK